MIEPFDARMYGVADNNGKGVFAFIYNKTLDSIVIIQGYNYIAISIKDFIEIADEIQMNEGDK